MNAPIIYICDHVFTGRRDVSLIVHHEDGMWQLTCGDGNHSENDGKIRPVHIDHVVKDEFLSDAILNTPSGYLSQRQPDGTWKVEVFDE